MEMKEMITVELHLNKETTLTVEEPAGVKLCELAEKYYNEPAGFEPIFALVDGLGWDMLHELNESCTVRFVDMRNRLARLVYQRTIYFLFRAVLYEIHPDAEVSIRFPLNDGILINFKDGRADTDLVWKIEKRMRELIDENVRFSLRMWRRNEILAGVRPAAVSEELQELVRTSEIKEVFQYSYNGYSEFFMDPVMESSLALKIFEMVPYDGNVIIRVPGFGNPAGLRSYRDDRKLYYAFSHLLKWREFVEVNYVKDLNLKIESGEWRDMILTSEAQHEKRVITLADRIASAGKRIILIAGPSASGKTTFAQRLCIQLRVNGLRPLYMGTDDYFLERSEMIPDENGRLNFEDLSAVDLNLFNQQMNQLLAGEEVDMPVFDFVSGSKRYGTRITRAEKDQPIVIEGIHALNPELTAQIPDEVKYRIYISPLTTLNIDENNRIPVTDARLIRRMARDMRSRGRTARETLDSWKDVRTGEEKNIFPFNGQADALFNSSLTYELAVLKPVIEPGLKSIPRGDERYIEAKRLLRILRCVKPLDNPDEISTNSIIREFVGGGIWVK